MTLHQSGRSHRQVSFLHLLVMVTLLALSSSTPGRAQDDSTSAEQQQDVGLADDDEKPAATQPATSQSRVRVESDEVATAPTALQRVDGAFATAVEAMGNVRAKATELGLTIIPAWKLEAYLKTINDTLTIAR